MKLNKERVDELVVTGYLNRIKHLEKDIYVLKYSRNCQFEKQWEELTLMARGLVIDGNYNIIARPFGKFFNIEEHDFNELPKTNFEVFDKMDGSLGIVFFYDGEWHICTSGSFISDQAVKGKEILESKNINVLDKTKTYLFEIIFDSNRIVVDYGNKEDLVMLAAFDTDSGEEVLYDELVIKYFNTYEVVRRFDGLNDLSKIREVQHNNKEGYVIRFSNGLRIKAKFAEYVRLHSILTQMSNLVIWKSLRYGIDLDIREVPDEFDDWVKETKKDLLANFGEYKYEINKRYYSIIRIFTDDQNSLNSTKNIDFEEFVKLAKKEKKYFDYLMMKFKQKDIDDSIWRNIRPKYTLPFIKRSVKLTHRFCVGEM